MNLKERTYLGYIVLLRLYIGYYLVCQGIRKYRRDFARQDWITAQIGDLSAVDLDSWYKIFLVQFVAPYRELFGHLVTWGEILVGICLLVGLFTRLSAVVGLFMLVNYALGPGMVRGGTTLGQQQTFIVVLLVILLSNAGRTLGLDGRLFKRR